MVLFSVYPGPVFAAVYAHADITGATRLDVHKMARDGWLMEASFERATDSIASLIVSVKAASDETAKVVRLSFSKAENALKLDQVAVVSDPDANLLTAAKSYSLPPRYQSYPFREYRSLH